MKKCVGLFSAFLLFSLSIEPLLTLQKTQAIQSSAWSGGAKLEDLGVPSGLYNGGNVECSYMTLKSRYVTNGRYSGDMLYYDESTGETEGSTYPDYCMTQTDHGLLTSGGYFVPTLNSNYTMPVVADPYNFIPVANSSAVVFSGSAPGYGTQYSINHNLKSIGYLSTRKFGSGVSAKYEKIWKISISKLDEFLSYGAINSGRVVHFDQIGFSPSGRYAVVHIMYRGFARLDLFTKELVPFQETTYSNNRTFYMNVSSDGRYVAMSENGSGQLVVHDLSGCQTSYAYGSWPETGSLPTAGCQSSDVTSSISASLSPIQNITGVRFAPNGTSLTAYIRYQSGASFVTKKIRLSANNYTSHTRGYLAMGDSFSSGEGDTNGSDWYEPGTDSQGNKMTFEERNLCHLSRRSYPYLLAVELGYLTTNSSSPPSDGLFHSVACSGAVIHNVQGGSENGLVDYLANESVFNNSDNQYSYGYQDSLSKWQPGHVKQLDFLNSEKAAGYQKTESKPEIITIGIGGNDAGFGDTIKACVFPGTCEQAEPGSLAAQNQALAIAALKPKLTKVYQKTKDLDPEARIYVLGYPNFVQDGGECANNVRFDSKEITMISEGIQYLNRVIRAAAQEAGVYYVDVETVLDGVDLCSSAADTDMAFNGVTAGDDINNILTGLLSVGICQLRTGCLGKESFHPNQKGHSLYKHRILTETNNLTVPMPEPAQTDYPLPNSSFFGQTAWQQVNYKNKKTYTIPLSTVEYGSFLSQTPQGTLMVAQGGFMPRSKVSIEVRSTPQIIAQQTVVVDGTISTDIFLPASLESGVHEIHILGLDAFGSPIDYFETIVVGVSENDFDGDGVLDSQDSCPIVVNVFVDVDKDDKDDACDNQIVIVATADTDSGNPPTTDSTDPQAVDQTAENKGQASNETVAGSEQFVSGQLVLGASTTKEKTEAEVNGLVQTGKGLELQLTFGIALIFIAVVLGFTAVDPAKYHTGRR